MVEKLVSEKRRLAAVLGVRSEGKMSLVHSNTAVSAM